MICIRKGVKSIDIASTVSQPASATSPHLTSSSSPFGAPTTVAAPSPKLPYCISHSTDATAVTEPSLLHISNLQPDDANAQFASPQLHSQLELLYLQHKSSADAIAIACTRAPSHHATETASSHKPSSVEAGTQPPSATRTQWTQTDGPVCACCHIFCGNKCCSCKEVHYCSERCQRHDWPSHKLTCSFRRVG